MFVQIVVYRTMSQSKVVIFRLYDYGTLIDFHFILSSHRVKDLVNAMILS